MLELCLLGMGKFLRRCERRGLGILSIIAVLLSIAIREVFRIAEVDPSEVDLIAVAGLVMTHAPLKERPLHVKLFKSLSPYVACHTFAKLYVRVLHRSKKMEHLRRVWWNQASKIARSIKSYLSQLLARVNPLRCSILL